MLVMVYARQEQDMEIANLLENCARFTGTVIQIADAHKLSDIYSDSRSAVLVMTLEGFDQGAAALKKVFGKIVLYSWGRLWDEEDVPFLLKIRAISVQRGNYIHAKAINQILTFFDWLSENTVINAFPQELQLESTSRCNAHCIMCEHFYMDNEGCGDLSYNTVHHLMAFFPFLKTIYIHGIGEPFLYPGLEDLLRLLKKYKVHASCNSNLSVLPDTVLGLMEDTFDSVMISCDGATEETFSSIRKGLSLRVLKRNVQKIRKEAPSVKLRMSVVAMRQNVKELPDIVAQAYEMGAQSIQFALMTPNPIIHNEEDSLLLYPGHATLYLKEAVSEGRKRGIYIAVPDIPGHFVSEEEMCREDSRMRALEDHSYEAADIKKTAARISEKKFHVVRDMNDDAARSLGDNCAGICDYLLKKPYIDHNGDVFMCCINPTYRMGNVRKDGGLAAIWNGKMYQKIRDSFYSGEIPGCCRDCQFIINRRLDMISDVKLTHDYYHKNYSGEKYQTMLHNLKEIKEKDAEKNRTVFKDK